MKTLFYFSWDELEACKTLELSCGLIPVIGMPVIIDGELTLEVAAVELHLSEPVALHVDLCFTDDQMPDFRDPIIMNTFRKLIHNSWAPNHELTKSLG
jgi:hypothetical protein